MEFVVLAKVVPALETMEFDPQLRTAVRGSAAMFLNPFDQRALRVALELRRPGESVRVVSLGPLGTLPVLRETRALGADRVQLLSDALFAGSDVLATSRALAAGIGPTAETVVLAGAWATDSETGEVGPEVAALLELPVVTGARAITRAPLGTELVIEVDTPAGWARARTHAPLVITVGEKIAKPLRVTPESIANLIEPAVEIVGAADLRIAAGSTGTAGSPTVVEAVAEAAAFRTPRVFAEGTAEDRVEGAIAALTPLLTRPARSIPPLPPVPGRREAGREVAVLATGADGELDTGSLGIVSELRRSLPGLWPSAIWIGPPPSSAATQRLEASGAVAGYAVDVSCRPFDSGNASEAVERVLDARPGLVAVVFPAEPFGQEVAGYVGGRKGLGLVADVVGLVLAPDGTVRWEKPSFGGRTVATIRVRTCPALATVRPGTFAGSGTAPSPTRLRWSPLGSVRSPPRVLWEATGRELDAGDPLDGHGVIVSVGMGIGGPDGIARLGPIIARWGAALTATRRVVDAGWVPRQRQVGLTGRALAPRLAVLLGVRGAVNHLIGWRRAGVVLGVNHDPTAPLFRDVDVGIVGSVEEVVPLLERPIARALGR